LLFWKKIQNEAIYTIIKDAGVELQGNCHGKTFKMGPNTLNKAINYKTYKGTTFIFGITGGPAPIVGDVWTNVAFLSTSYDQARAAGYGYSSNPNVTSYLLRFNMDPVYNVNGAFIENCSEVPEDHEFLVDIGHCWKITAINPNYTTGYKTYKDPKNSDYSDNPTQQGKFTLIDLNPELCPPVIPKIQI